jgi:hypothetical protein
MIVAIIVIVGVALVATTGCCVLAACRKRRAYKRGVVPAKLLMGGAQRHSKTGGKEAIDSYELRMKRVPASKFAKVGDAGDAGDAGNAGDAEGGGAVVREESCPVCLKATVDIKTLVELRCTHQLCEGCMRRIVSADRLHARCPLCRVYILTEREGVEEDKCCRGPVRGEAETEMGRNRRPVDGNPRAVDESRRVEFGGGDTSRWMVV